MPSFFERLLCKIFGHVNPMYGSSPAYGKIREGAIDGIGRVHADVIAECDRCWEEFVIVKIHLPDKI